MAEWDRIAVKGSKQDLPDGADAASRRCTRRLFGEGEAGPTSSSRGSSRRRRVDHMGVGLLSEEKRGDQQYAHSVAVQHDAVLV